MGLSVSDFVKVIQKALGVSQTGVWTPATQDAFWARVRTNFRIGMSFPVRLPWAPQLCMTDPDPAVQTLVDSFIVAGTVPIPDCIDTGDVFLDLLEDGSDRIFPEGLSISADQRLSSEADLRVLLTGLKAHIQAQLAKSEVDAAATSTGISTATIGWIVGGVVVAGLLLWVVSSGGKADASA